MILFIISGKFLLSIKFFLSPKGQIDMNKNNLNFYEIGLRRLIKNCFTSCNMVLKFYFIFSILYYSDFKILNNFLFEFEITWIQKLELLDFSNLD